MHRLLLDEGLSAHAAQSLRERGFDAIHVKEIGLLSAPDEAILQAAREQERILFTLDHDFHQILALSQETMPSVVLLRFEHLKAADAAQTIARVLELFGQDLKQGVALSVSPGGVRLRRLPLRTVE